MEAKKYKLVGIENCWEIVPAGVYPIFADENNEYYRAYSSGNDDDKCFSFTDFVKMSKEASARVKLLKDCMVRAEEIEDTYSEGSTLALAMEINQGIVYVGRIDKYLNFISENKEELASNPNERELMLKDLNDEIDYLTTIVEEARNQGAIPRSL